MPIVRSYPLGEVSPQPLPGAMPDVPAAGDINLFGGNRARDLQVAGQNLGQASDSLAVLYERTARAANDTRVQDLTNRFLDGRRAILQSYSDQTGADAIAGADVATGKLTSLKDEVFGQTANGYQRQRLGPILDVHLAAATADVTRHAVAQQEVYSRGVATKAIETSRAEAIADPALMDNAVLRAEGAARALHAGQPPETIEAGARTAGGSVIASVIGDRLARNDPMGVTLFRQYADRFDDHTRRTLGAAVETLSNTLDAAAWLRDRSATLGTPAPTGDATLDAVNAASTSTAEPPPVVSSAGTLLDQDGIAGTRERLDEIEHRRHALTALNESEFVANPTRLRANQVAINANTARSRAAVKAESDGLYADLRRHLTTGGPNGGPAVTPPPPTIMSRLTDAQQDAVTAQVNANIEGRKPGTDPQTWYAIRQGLTGDNVDERQRWASKNLTQFMGHLSAEDFAALEKLQSAVRSNDGGAEQSRLQAITRMANDVLRSVGIDPTPRPDAASDRSSAQAARFHRALQDELSAFESRGRKPTEAEAYDIANGLKDTAIENGWLKVDNRSASPAMADYSETDDTFHKDGVPLAQAGPDEPPEQRRRMSVSIDLERLRRMREEDERREAAEQPASGTGGAAGAPATEPYPGSQEYRVADEQARRITARPMAEEAGGQGGPQTEPPPGSPEQQAAEKEARRIVEREEADRRDTDRMITDWFASRPNDGSPPEVPPGLAERLSADEKKEIEAYAASTDSRNTIPEIHDRILSNLLNFNSQVRLKWAREPLFRYREYLSAEDFAKLARIQSRLDPRTGQVSGFAPVPADLAPLYDWLAPEPDWHYGTFGLAAVMLAPQPHDIGVAVVRAPHRRRPVPPDIQPVAARPVQRQLERIGHDLRLGDGKDRPAAELRDALRPGVTLVRRDGLPQLGLLLRREVRHVIPRRADDELAHAPAKRFFAPEPSTKPNSLACTMSRVVSFVLPTTQTLIGRSKRCSHRVDASVYRGPIPTAPMLGS